MLADTHVRAATVYLVFTSVSPLFIQVLLVLLLKSLSLAL